MDKSTPFTHPPEDWVPPAPPKKGSFAWKNKMAFDYAIDKFGSLPKRNVVVKLPKCKGYELGYFAIYYVDGWNYFRVDELE